MNQDQIRLGYERLRETKPRQAIEIFKEICKQDKEAHLAFNGLGIGLAQLENWEMSTMAFLQAWQLSPDKSSYSRNCLLTMLRTGDIKPALNILRHPSARIPYRLGHEVIKRFATGDDALTFLKDYNMYEPYLQYLSFLGIPSSSELISRFVYANMLFPRAPWREKALDSLDEEDLSRIVEWRGLEYLKSPLDKGQGVILLHSHFTLERLASLLLAKKGYIIHSLEFSNRLADFQIKGAEAFRSIELDPESKFYLKQVFQAKKTIARGEILQMAGDGDYGASATRVNFFGEPRTFRTGFAELSLLSNAPVIPVYCTTNLTGRITIEFLPALDCGNPEADKQTRINALLSDYARGLESEWRQHPDNITWQHMSKFVRRNFRFIAEERAIKDDDAR